MPIDNQQITGKPGADTGNPGIAVPPPPLKQKKKDGKQIKLQTPSKKLKDIIDLHPTTTYGEAKETHAVMTFGRMNPPTVGHGKVMDTLAQKSGKADYKVFVSQTQDAKKNPLSYSDKIKHTRKMFPKHARNIMVDKSVKTAINAMVVLYDQGYKSVTMVVGEDRITEFEVLLKKYNGQKARHGFYNFKNIKVVSAGARDPDASGVEGMSASKQRENASKNDFVAFSQGVPKSMSNPDTRKSVKRMKY